eukprot:scaffold93644_cov69-Phaeocystis_antarctica.AAC.2
MASSWLAGPAPRCAAIARALCRQFGGLLGHQGIFSYFARTLTTALSPQRSVPPRVGRGRRDGEAGALPKAVELHGFMRASKG